MFESIVEALHAELLSLCPADRAYHMADLKGQTLPEPVGRYAADLAKKAAAAELEPAHPDRMRWIASVEDTTKTYDRHLASSLSNAVIPADEWEKVLRSAIRDALEHTTRPRMGLVSAVFGDSDGLLEQTQVLDRISLFHAGLPLRAAVVRALKKGAAGSVDRDQLRSLVDQAHDAIIFDFGRTEWRRELQPLVSILAAARIEGEVPVILATALLDDLGQTAAADVLRSGGQDAIGLREFVDLLAGPEDEDVADRQIDIFDSKPKPAPDPGSVPLWQRFQKNLNEPIVSSAKPMSAHMDHTKRPEPESTATPVEANGPQEAASGSSDEEESHKPLWQKYHAGADPENADISVGEIEIRTLGKEGTRNRDTFIAHLFEGDEETYIDVLHQLQQSTSWPQASRVIAEGVFKRFQVNIYSEEAVAFTNAVESRFRLKEASD